MTTSRFIKTKNIERRLRLLKEKEKELQTLKGHLENTIPEIDYSTHAKLFEKSNELKSEIFNDIKQIDSILKNGIKNISPSFATATSSNHGTWGNLKGQYIELKSKLQTIEKHVDFLILTFTKTASTNLKTKAELVSEISNYSEHLKELKENNPVSVGLDTLAVILIILTILRKN